MGLWKSQGKSFALATLLMALSAIVWSSSITASGAGSSPYGPYFGIWSSPTSITVRAPSFATSTITLTSFNNFGGVVSLSVSGESIDTSLNASSVTLTPGATVTSILNVSAPFGTTGTRLVPLTVTAIGGQESTSTYVNVNLEGPDFDLNLQSNLLPLDPGGSGTRTLNVTGSLNFTGEVNLAIGTPSSGFTVSLAKENVTLSPNITFQSTTISVSVSNSTPPGEYLVTISGNTNYRINATHMVVFSKYNNLYIEVKAPNSLPVPPSNNPWSQILFYALTGVVVLAVSVITAYWRKQAKKTSHLLETHNTRADPPKNSS